MDAALVVLLGSLLLPSPPPSHPELCSSPPALLSLICPPFVASRYGLHAHSRFFFVFFLLFACTPPLSLVPLSSRRPLPFCARWSHSRCRVPRRGCCCWRPAVAPAAWRRLKTEGLLRARLRLKRPFRRACMSGRGLGRRPRWWRLAAVSRRGRPRRHPRSLRRSWRQTRHCRSLLQRQVQTLPTRVSRGFISPD